MGYGTTTRSRLKQTLFAAPTGRQTAGRLPFLDDTVKAGAKENQHENDHDDFEMTKLLQASRAPACRNLPAVPAAARDPPWARFWIRRSFESGIGSLFQVVPKVRPLGWSVLATAQQIARRGLLVQNQRGLFLERFLQCSELQQKNGEIRILVEH